MELGKRVAVWALLFLFVVGLFAGSVKIGHATPITVDRVFTSQNYDGEISLTGSNYTTIWQQTTGVVDDECVYMSLGQAYDAIYLVVRSYVFFDTSIIPDGASILSANLSLYEWADTSTTDFNVTVQNGQPTYPHTPLIVGDYDKSFYSGNGGSRNISSLPHHDYWNITLNADGISWVEKDTLTKLCLRSNKDIDGTPPTNYEYVLFTTREQGEAYAPKLYVTYTFEGYSYIVHGPYYENGDVADCTTTVTLQIEYMASNSTVLNGTDTIADTVTFQTEQQGVTLSWNITSYSNQTRYIWLTSASSQEYWIFMPDPDTPCYLYTFVVNDFVGISNATLESQTVMSGFYKTLEREPYAPGNSMPFYLLWGKHYNFVLSCDKGTKTWANIVPSSSSEIQLVIVISDFPTTCQALNVSISVLRQNNTWVSVTYSDSDLETTSGSVTIWHTDNLTDTTDNVTSWTGNTLALDWLEAEESTDYWVNITAVKDGQTYNWVLTAPHIITEEPWAGIFDPLGVWPVPSQYLAGAFVLFTVMALFSAANLAAGMGISVVVAAILNYLRWLNVSWSLIAVGFALAVLVAIDESQKRGA